MRPEDPKNQDRRIPVRRPDRRNAQTGHLERPSALMPGHDESLLRNQKNYYYKPPHREGQRLFFGNP